MPKNHHCLEEDTSILAQSSMQGRGGGIQRKGRVPALDCRSSLDYSTKLLRQNEWIERKKRYESRNWHCGKDLIYNIRTDELKPRYCNIWSCPRCRPRKMRNLLYKIVEVAVVNGLVRHMIITVPGKEYREKNSAEDSFNFLPRKFNDFRTLYKREFGHNLSYIALPRSQSDGYCHFHCLIGSYIPKEWLDKTLNSLGLGFGYISYVDVHRLKSYLSTYWYKEHEWFIPKNKRHYSCSRDLDLTLHYPNSNWFFISPPTHCSPGFRLSCVHETIERISGKPPPLWYSLYCFYFDNIYVNDVYDISDAYQQKLNGKLIKWVAKEHKRDFVKQKHFVKTVSKKWKPKK